MPIIELRGTDFTRTFSGTGTYFSELETSVYVVDTVLSGSTSGIGSLRINWNGEVLIRWIAGNPPINFGSNIRMGICIRYLTVNLPNGTQMRAGIFIGGLQAGIGVENNGGIYRYFIFPYLFSISYITPNYFEQIIMRQESALFLSHYSFSNSNTKTLTTSFTLPFTSFSGQAGFFLHTVPSSYGIILFDYFFIEEYVGA